MKCPFGGKVSYESEKAAKHVISAVGRKNMRIYRCQNCYMYHLTTEPKNLY